MKTLKKIVMVTTVLAMMMTSAVFASNGSLTFYHGLVGSNLHGSVESTSKEKSLGVILTANFSNGTDATTGGKKLNFNESFCEVNYYAKGKSGEFSCKYYCNGSHVGTSSKPWDFDL